MQTNPPKRTWCAQQLQVRDDPHIAVVWQEWKSDYKPWVGMEIPYDELGHWLFAVATSITIGDGNKAKFWISAWLDGRTPKDIAPKKHDISRRKN